MHYLINGLERGQSHWNLLVYIVLIVTVLYQIHV